MDSEATLARLLATSRRYFGLDDAQQPMPPLPQTLVAPARRVRQRPAPVQVPRPTLLSVMASGRF